MLGILIKVVDIIGAGVSYMSMQNEGNTNRNRAKNNNELTYRDGSGKERLVSNNRWVTTGYDSNHNLVIKDMKTSQVYYNITREEKRKKGQELLAKGKTVRFKMSGEKARFHGHYLGFSEVDIRTNLPVRDININGIWFYMELKNGHILRPTDKDVEFVDILNLGNFSVDKIIEIFNKRQDNMSNELEDHIDSWTWIGDNFLFPYSRVGVGKSIYIDSDENVHAFSNYYPNKMYECIENDIGKEEYQIRTQRYDKKLKELLYYENN